MDMPSRSWCLHLKTRRIIKIVHRAIDRGTHECTIYNRICTNSCRHIYKRRLGNQHHIHIRKLNTPSVINRTTRLQFHLLLHWHDLGILFVGESRKSRVGERMNTELMMKQALRLSLYIYRWGLLPPCMFQGVHFVELNNTPADDMINVYLSARSAPPFFLFV